MIEICYKLRECLKCIPFILRFNSAWKSRKLRNGLKSLRRQYANEAALKGITYQERKALIAAKRNILNTMAKNTHSRSERLRVFWVGANLDQDRSGFLQALEHFCDVICFSNTKGEYGLWYKDEKGRIQVYSPDIVALNDEALIRQVLAEKSDSGIDLLMGQMWANYISKKALNQIREMGIPVINVSMDDRLPDNWDSKKGCRLGAVGLIDAVDLVLTTTAEACLWYEVEGCPALFWPLASDPNVFFPGNALQHRDIDVLFVGNCYGIRGRIVEFLINSGINVSCWGGGWPNGHATAEQCAKLFQRSKIILGIGTVGYCEDVFTLKLRDFDAPMSGALYITHRNPDLLMLFEEDQEIICYLDNEECAKKIKYFLQNPQERCRVAKAGQRKALERYRWDVRIAETFKAVGIM